MKKALILLTFFFSSQFIQAQSGPDEDQLGAWYMYFFNADFKNSKFGIQGDYQFRFWNFGSDLEQVLLRTGITYRPDNINGLFTLGYGNITSGIPGDSDATSGESRIYQEALLPHKISNKIQLTHRFRYEQRFVSGQDFRTRYRYNLFMNILLNNTSLEKNTAYIALYNEIFINGQREIGDERVVQLFDRNRTYLGFGYKIFDNSRVQIGWMKQTTVTWSKGQMQLSLHQSF